MLFGIAVCFGCDSKRDVGPLAGSYYNPKHPAEGDMTIARDGSVSGTVTDIITAGSTVEIQGMAGERGFSGSVQKNGGLWIANAKGSMTLEGNQLTLSLDVYDSSTNTDFGVGGTLTKR